MKSRAAARLVLAGLTTALVVMVLLSTGATAQVSDPYGNGEPTVLPTRITHEGNPEVPEDDPDVLGTRFSDVPDSGEVAGAADEQPGILPFTGGEVTVFVVVALGLLASGALIVRRTRTARDRSL